MIATAVTVATPNNSNVCSLRDQAFTFVQLLTATNISRHLQLPCMCRNMHYFRLLNLNLQWKTSYKSIVALLSIHCALRYNICFLEVVSRQGSQLLLVTTTFPMKLLLLQLEHRHSSTEAVLGCGEQGGTRGRWPTQAAWELHRTSCFSPAIINPRHPPLIQAPIFITSQAHPPHPPSTRSTSQIQKLTKVSA